MLQSRQVVWQMAVAALLVAFGFAWASNASAAWFFKEDFGPVAQPNFGHANTLAVDPQNHDLLVVGLEPLPISGFKATISRFKSDGTPNTFEDLGTNVIDGEGSGPPCSPPSPECDGTPQGGLAVTEVNPLEIAVAVDNSGGATDGDIYVTQRFAHLVDIFSRGGTYLGQITGSSEGPFVQITGVAVDSSGAVYVADNRAGAGVIHKYAPGLAAPITNANNAENLPRATERGVGALAAGVGSTGGSIFAGKFAFEPARFDSASGAKQCVFGPEGSEVSGGTESVALAVDSSTGHLFNARRLNVEEYEASCLSASETPIDEISLTNTAGEDLQGMAVDGEEGLLYISRRGTPSIEVWKERVVPTVQTAEANPVSDEAAVLRGSDNPNGEAITECFFDYGSTAAYGTRIPCEEYESGGEWHRLTSPAELGSGRDPIAVRSEVVGLAAGSNYHFQLSAANENSGGAIGGGDRIFSTSGAQISEVEVTQVTSASARIGARLDPRGEATSVSVQYLTQAQYLANPPAEPFRGAMLAPVPAQVVPPTVSGSGFLFNGSLMVKYVLTKAGAFAPGQEISGLGIPAGTTIKAVPNPGELELSKPADELAQGLNVEAALTARGPQPVNQQLVGLLPNTKYRFRLVAMNGVTSDSAARAFTTPPSPAAVLPDDRAYELISPSEKAGEVLAPEPNLALTGERCGECLAGFSTPTMPMQSSADGTSVLYEGQAFSAGLAPGGNEYVSRRGEDAWSTNALSGPATTGNWQAASGDLSRLVLEQADPPLSPAAPIRGGKAFRNLYLSHDGIYEPLITIEPPTREPGASGTFSIRYAAANAGTPGEPGTAFTHIAFEANDALTPPVAGVAPAAPAVDYRPEECSFAPCDLYEWSAGVLHLINVLPGNNQAAGEATIGSGRLLNIISIDPNRKEVPNVGSSISDDGRTVFWSSGETGHVYARIDAERTVPVDGPATCKANVPLETRACFLAASSDGSRVLLSNGALDSLVPGGIAYANEEDLTAGRGGFQGILGNSDDLSRIYFVDTASLTGPNAAGASPNEGGSEEDNLYLWESGSEPGMGRTSFISGLQPEDNGPSINFGDWRSSPSLRTAQSTQDGNFLVFMSRSSLTGYDNIGPCGRHEATVPCPEVFEYSASAQTLSCVSCNPTGQRPAGASILSPLRPQGESVSMPQVAHLPDDGGGRVFFESEDALTPQDTNGSVMDVYEWEPQRGAGMPGSDTCNQGGSCVNLISGGQSASPAVFLSSSSNGDDAFVLTRQRLLPRDQDSQMDLYDARAGGGVTEETQPACNAEGCRSSLPSPEVSAPLGGSNSFTGPGNPKSPTKAKKKHQKKKKKHKKHHQHAKQATKRKTAGAK